MVDGFVEPIPTLPLDEIVIRAVDGFAVAVPNCRAPESLVMTAAPAKAPSTILPTLVATPIRSAPVPDAYLTSISGLEVAKTSRRASGFVVPILTCPAVVAALGQINIYSVYKRRMDAYRREPSGSGKD